jgi:hypothetical protein
VLYIRGDCHRGGIAGTYYNFIQEPSIRKIDIGQGAAIFIMFFDIIIKAYAIPLSENALEKSGGLFTLGDDCIHVSAGSLRIPESESL